MPPDDITERWYCWLGAVVIVAWSLGYACATGAWSVVLFGLVLLVICVVFTFQEHQRDIHDAVARSHRPWRRASDRKTKRGADTWT